MPYIPIPPPHEPFIDNDNKVSEVWYRYLNSNNTGLNSATTTLVAGLASAFANVSIQVVSTSTGYHPTAGTKYVLGIATGPGGGGAGSKTAGATQTDANGGGGAGATCLFLWSAAQLGTSAAVVIGPGGAAGTTAGTAGSTGSVTSVTPQGTVATIIANCGGAGTTDGTPALGGSSTGGFLNLRGGHGSGGGVASTFSVFPGYGGGSFWGGGPGMQIKSASGVFPGTSSPTPGTGGGGAASRNSTDGAAGGNGTDGVVVFIEFRSS